MIHPPSMAATNILEKMWLILKSKILTLTLQVVLLPGTPPIQVCIPHKVVSCQTLIYWQLGFKVWWICRVLTRGVFLLANCFTSILADCKPSNSWTGKRGLKRCLQENHFIVIIIKESYDSTSPGGACNCCQVSLHPIWLPYWLLVGFELCQSLTSASNLSQHTVAISEHFCWGQLKRIVFSWWTWL